MMLASQSSLIPRDFRKGQVLFLAPILVPVAILCIFAPQLIPAYLPLITFTLQILFLWLDYRSTKKFLALGYEEKNKLLNAMMTWAGSLEMGVVSFYVLLELFPLLLGLVLLPLLGMTPVAVVTLFTTVPAASHGFAYAYNRAHVGSPLH